MPLNTTITGGYMKKIKVLLADDHTLFRDSLQRVLENEQDMDCVAIAGNGEEAVSLVARYAPDVVLMDIAMPQIDGIEAAERIKKSNPNTAILIVSAYIDDHYVLSCIEAGVSGYLLKTVSVVDLINAIRMAYDGECVYNVQVATKLMQLASAKSKKSNGVDELHEREIQILKLAATGMSNKQIAQNLNISPQTVGTHFVNIFRKLGVESRMQATLCALKERLITFHDIDGGLEPTESDKSVEKT